MVINIYYGGRGIIEDPTLYVLQRIEKVLDELAISHTRYNLYDMRNNITTLPQTFKNADGIIIADNVEWLGLSGLTHQFLDACWFYADKEKISSLYMTPVVVSTTYGEKEAHNTLIKAWEMLGGKLCDGISCYVSDTIEFESNPVYADLIEHITENIRRSIVQKRVKLPSSNYALRQTLTKASLELTPKESEQLSKYVSDEVYVQKQKEDIEELSAHYKQILGAQGTDIKSALVNTFNNHFTKKSDLNATYQFIIDDKTYLYMAIQNGELTLNYEKRDNTDVIIKLTSDTLSNITYGRITFQGAFMTSVMKLKGNMGLVRALDTAFNFMD